MHYPIFLFLFFLPLSHFSPVCLCHLIYLLFSVLLNKNLIISNAGFLSISWSQCFIVYPVINTISSTCWFNMFTSRASLVFSIKVRISRKLLLTSFQYGDISNWNGILNRGWGFIFALIFHSQQSNSWRGKVKDFLPKQSNWGHQRRNAVPEQKQIITFWLKITKTIFFQWINLHRLIVHLKTSNATKINCKFWFHVDFKVHSHQVK